MHASKSKVGSVNGGRHILLYPMYSYFIIVLHAGYKAAATL